jgi:hypothetical protein
MRALPEVADSEEPYAGSEEFRSRPPVQDTARCAAKHPEHRRRDRWAAAEVAVANVVPFGADLCRHEQLFKLDLRSDGKGVRTETSPHGRQAGAGENEVRCLLRTMGGFCASARGQLSATLQRQLPESPKCSTVSSSARR